MNNKHTTTYRIRSAASPGTHSAGRYWLRDAWATVTFDTDESGSEADKSPPGGIAPETGLELGMDSFRKLRWDEEHGAIEMEPVFTKAEVDAAVAAVEKEPPPPPPKPAPRPPRSSGSGR